MTTSIIQAWLGRTVLRIVTWLVVASLLMAAVSGAAVRPHAAVRRGQIVVWSRPPWEEPDAPGAFAVGFEDADLLAVAKPAGMPTLPGAGFLNGTHLHKVRAYAPGAAPLHIAWAGGRRGWAILFARTPETRRAMSSQWSVREVGKRYRALADGAPAWDAITIVTPIGPVPHALLGTVHAAHPDGKEASTHVTVVERRSRSFLCDVRIASGRPHQIRIHLAASGHPLVGDPLYVPGGVPAAGTRALPGDPGYHLHATELTFRHPRTGRATSIECAPPPLLRIAC